MAKKLIKIPKKLRQKLADKVEMLSLVLFVFSLFLLDVSANNVGAYGLDTQASLLGTAKILSTSAFWFGFIAACFFFFLITIRSLYNAKKYPTKTDLGFAILGVISLMIILSGGILIFWHPNTLVIPFFSMNPTRITYYHIGIALSIISVLYFTLTK